MFKVTDWINECCERADLDETTAKKMMKQASDTMTKNMKALNEIRDITGIHFTSELQKIPGTLLAEVTRQGGGKMSKLKGWEYDQVQMVSCGI